MIYKTEPENFISRFEVVSCYVEHDGKILILHRQNHKPQGNTWGLPAGKIDGNEDKIEAMLREIFEETGYKIDLSNLEYLDKVYVKYPEYSFIYHMFRLVVNSEPLIKINPEEHQDFKWVSPNEALNLELIQDLEECLKISYKL
ncbi:MAG: NUDIX hydrolase [Candidatus Falkowbacteria bacterium]